MMVHDLRNLGTRIRNKTGKLPVVIYMVMAVVLIVSDPDLGQPLDRPRPYPSRKHQSNGVTVIWRDWMVIHLIRKNHIVPCIHSIFKGYACGILPFTKFISAFVIDPVMFV